MAARINEEVRRVLAEAAAPTDAQRRIVEGALGRLGRRPGRSVRRTAIALAAVAAVVAGVVLLAATRARGPVGRRDEPAGAAARREPLPLAGAVWVGTAEERAFTLGPHQVELSPHTRLRLTGGSAGAPRLELGQGRARFVVAPLAAGHGFSVQTPQVRVIVIGTRFSLEVSRHCTKLEVSSGRVQALPERGGQGRVLGAGEQHAFCDGGELDPAGRQLQRALSLARSGQNLAEAETALASYLEREPRGTYAEEAHYFLILVKRRLGKESEAVAQARLFLERFPSTARAQAVRAWLEKAP